MIRHCLPVFCLLLLFMAPDVKAQPFVGGLKKMKGRDIAVGNKLAVSDEEVAKLPRSVSYEGFCPTAGNQNGKATTVAYATAYYLRTILENQARNVSGAAAVNTNRFSPTYLYNRIKAGEDADCSAGADLEAALRVLRTEGVPLLKTVGEQACNLPVSATAAQEAAQYRISDYGLLFGPNDSRVNKLRLLKKTLAGGTPVVVEFQAPGVVYAGEKSMDAGPPTKPSTWLPIAWHSASLPTTTTSLGGAFQVANSWGSGWGDGGKTWVTYQDMPTFVRGAYYVAPVSTTARPMLLAGRVDIRLTTGESVPVALTSVGGVRAYQPSGPYPAGKEIKVYASTSEPMYLYVFGIGSGGVNRYVPADDDAAPVVRPGEPFVFPSMSQTVTLEKALGEGLSPVSVQSATHRRRSGSDQKTTADTRHTAAKSSGYTTESGRFYSRVRFRCNDVQPVGGKAIGASAGVGSVMTLGVAWTATSG